MAETDLDSKLVRRMAEMHEGMAFAHLSRAFRLDENPVAERRPPRRGWSQDAMLAASGLVLAASCWSLVEPRKAASLYLQAAEVYRGMGHSYWLVLALASGNSQEIAGLSGWLSERRLSHLAVAFGLVGEAVRSEKRPASQSERLETHWRHVGNVPVGRLGIPLDTYGECARAMRAARVAQRPEPFISAARNYLARAGEVRRMASHDTFHWQRLMSTVLPAEPEAIAMTRAMSHMSREMFRLPLAELMPDLGRHERVLADVGDDMSATTEGDGPLRA
jgi:hypothetical protein